MPCGLTLGSWLLDDGRSPAVITLQFNVLATTSGNGPYRRQMCWVCSVYVTNVAGYYRHKAVAFSRLVCSKRLLMQRPVT